MSELDLFSDDILESYTQYGMAWSELDDLEEFENIDSSYVLYNDFGDTFFTDDNCAELDIADLSIKPEAQ